MNRYIFLFLIAAFSLILHAKCVAQKNIVYGAGITYTVGVPTFVPPGNSSRVAIDTVTSKWYEYATPGGWRWSGDRVQDISGCAAPAYTPGKAQSRLVLNSCTELQNGHGPELYKYTGSAWLCLNCGGNYTAGDGIDITGTEITNTGDLSNTNELQTLSVAGNNLTISDGNTVTLPTPSSTLDALTDVTITSPTNAQILQYNTATTQWINATLSAITGSISNGQVAFGSGTAISGSNNLFWDNTNSRIGIGTASPTANVHIKGADNLAATSSFLIENLSGGSVAWARNDGGFHIGNISGNRWTLSQNGISFTNGVSSSNVTFSVGVTSFPFAPVAFGTTIDGSTLYQLVVGGSTSYAGGVNGGALIAKNYTPSSGSSAWQSLRISPTINQTGTANGAVYGIRYAPSVSSIIGKHYAATFSSGQVGIGTDAPIEGAALEVKSTTGVMVPPNMTSTQRDAIASPPNGIIYNTTTGKFQGYAAGTWVDFH